MLEDVASTYVRTNADLNVCARCVRRVLFIRFTFCYPCLRCADYCCSDRCLLGAIPAACAVFARYGLWDWRVTCVTCVVHHRVPGCDTCATRATFVNYVCYLAEIRELSCAARVAQIRAPTAYVTHVTRF